MKHPAPCTNCFHGSCRNSAKKYWLKNRLKGLLSDLGSSTYRKYRVAIARSVSDNLGEKISSLKGLEDADYSLKLCNIRQAFQEDNFFRHGIADYIIDCYLFALGRIDTVEEYTEKEILDQGMAGELSFTPRDGEEYCGNLSKDDERSGFGISKNETGNYYAGEWKLNLKNGVGMYVGDGRSKYAGEWRLNRRNGAGIQISQDGIRYAGEWKNGKKNGIGLLLFPNGERMCTFFQDGEIKDDAIGIYYLKDGSYISGRMSPDEYGR